MAGPAITVLMNCFNGAKFLAEAVESVRVQTRSDWELLFWDNQSTDDSAAIVKQFKDERIRYHRAAEHTPLGPARRLACREARGRWLGVLDTDDVWLPDKLERQLARAEKAPEAALIYGRCEIFADGVKDARTGIHPPPCQSLPEGRIFKQLARENFMSLPAILYRRDMMESVGGFQDYVHGADYDLSLRIARARPVAAVDAVVCRYRWHADNASHRMFEVGMDEVEKILTDLDAEPGAAEGLRIWRANHALGCLVQRRYGDAWKALRGGSKGEFARLVWRGIGRRLGGRRGEA